ncbi:MAG TPA: RagB/SusD family nutrient uptake outer membrane protein [Parasegetibacter sp.]
MNNNIFRIPIFLGLVTLFLSGCSKWLDVSPKSTLKEEELLSTQDGFIDVLNGVYIRITEDRLYGQELGYGFIDVLAQYYDNIPSTPSHQYNQASKYNYENASVKNIIDNIWTGMYRAITNCNVIVERIDDKQDVFTGNNYKRVKGEALALRAFMHFDLLRLFAPAYSTTTRDQKGIPYVNKISKTAIPFSTIDQVCQMIEADLLAARNLLHDFDIMGPVDESQDASLVYTVSNRKVWINYYAATALLARLELFRNNKTKAMQYVDELTTDHARLKIKWAQATQFYYYYNANEKIFGVFMDVGTDMKAKVTERFDPESAINNLILKVSLARTMEVYETSSGGASDYRYLEWNSKTADNYLTKFSTLPGIPLLKIGEVYLIAAECLMDTDPTRALDYLNELRNNRGLVSLSAGVDLNDEITKEYRKEFLGEGQLFFYYKRRGFQFIPGWGTQMTDDQYVLPIPDAELEFNN